MLVHAAHLSAYGCPYSQEMEVIEVGPMGSTVFDVEAHGLAAGILHDGVLPRLNQGGPSCSCAL